jgi:small-conductance mechanosensitive channel
LHSAIYQSLADNHIEIPFPQRDLHLKMSELEGAIGRQSVEGRGRGHRDAAE